MCSKAIRIPMLLATLGSLGSTLAFGHEAHEPALALAPFPTAHAHFDAALAIVASVLALMGLGIWLVSRILGGSRDVRPAYRGKIAAPVAGALLVLLLWILPWLSLHDTHHALETGDVSCSVAQIVHSQAGGILQSAPVLAPQSIVFTIVLSDPTVLSTRPVPQPAARSPPV